MPTVPTTPPSVPPGPTAAEGVAAMIPVANITLEDALLDNPNFRANIKLFEGQVFFIENWLVALQRSMNQFTEEWKRLNEVTGVLNKRAEVPLLSQGMLSAQYTIPAMKLVGGAFRTTLALKNKYISEVNEQVLKPLDDFLKTDLKEFKESKKIYDKALEKYETTLAKYNGQSRQKEASALREEAFQLYDTRKAYIQAAMSCSMLCIRLQDGLDQLVLGVFLDLIATQHDYFSGNADHFGSMALQVLQLKTYMKDHKEASAISLAELEQNKERYTTDAIEYWKPSRSLKCYSNTTPASKSTIGHAALGPVFAAQMAGQVPISSLMVRPATISQFSTTAGNGRTPLQMNQFQPQSSLPQLVTAPPGGTGAGGGLQTSSSISAPLDNGPSAADTLSVSMALRPSNGPSNSLPTAAGGSRSLPSSTASSSTNLKDEADSMEPDCTPTTKQGYLNIRIPQPKNRAPVWQRKYFFIQEGEFGFESVVSNPTVGSQVVQSERIAVLLCEVRYGLSSSASMAMSGGGNPSSGSQGLAMVQMERRFCFEVVCATQSYLLQAETEDDLMSWVDTFEAAKRDVFLQQNLPRYPEPEEPYSPMIPDSAGPSFSFSGEDLTGSQEGVLSRSNGGDMAESTPLGLGLSWAASVPGVSLLLGSYAGTGTGSGTGPSKPATESPETADKPATDSENQTTDQDTTAGSGFEMIQSDPKPSLAIVTSPSMSLPQTSMQPVKDTDSHPHARSKSLGDSNSVVPEQSSGPSQQLSEIERLMTSSHHLVPKATPLPVSEIPHYPMELVIRNRELHLRFHGTKVHSKEYVLHSWTSGFLDDSRPDKPIMVYGRIFLTQSGMYFYARGLSVETKRMFRFSSIRGIECEQKDISTEWRIETMDRVQHVFCQFTLTETEYQVLHLIWTNVHQAKDRLPVKELFRRTMLITNKPKGSAGSGSLAETESNHQTTRDGKMTHHGGSGGEPVESLSGAVSEAASIKTNDEDWGDLDEPEEDFPSTMEAPSGSVSCHCPGHLEKVELEQTFSVSAKKMSRLLFGPNSPVWKEFHERRNNTVQSIGEWTQDGVLRTRIVKFLMVVNNPLVKLNHTDCVETQTCEVEEDYLRYSYTTKSSVLAMPYSDAFTPILRYCITYVSKDRCKLTCSVGIEWHKNPLVKAMIKAQVFKGTSETVRDLAEILQLHLEQHARGQNGGPQVSGMAAGRDSGLTKGSRGPSFTDNHQRSDSSKIMISLHGPDDDHSILLDPQGNNVATDLQADNSKDSRVPGARRHTVSAAAGSGGLMYSGPRVQGHWPTGAPPSFVPIGSKASRTKLLGRPSRSALKDETSTNKSSVAALTSSSKLGSAGWLKRTLFGTLHSKDESQRRLNSTRLLFIVLVVSSLINIWAAYNSQRMLNTAWKLKGRGSKGGPLKGYPEPLNRMLGGFGSSRGKDFQDDDNVRNVRVAARAVFLKDLEEQMLRGELDGFEDAQTIDHKSFEIFLEVRDSFRVWSKPPQDWFSSDPERENQSTIAPSSSPLSSKTLSPASPSPSSSSSPYTATYDEQGSAFTPARYPWLLPQHRRWATRIIFQRDRVGIMRHDLLVTFELLNQLERHLLETEYVNWIMDERSRCRLWEARQIAQEDRMRRVDEDNLKRGVMNSDEGLLEEEEEEGSAAGMEPEDIELKGEFLRQLETEAMNAEQVKQQILHEHEHEHENENDHDHDQVQGREYPTKSNKALKKDQKKIKDRVTKEFCQGLERQMELFLVETHKMS